MDCGEQATDQAPAEQRLLALEQKIAELEGGKSYPLGLQVLAIVFVVTFAVLVAIGVNVDRPVPAGEQGDPIDWAQTVSAAAVLVGSLGSLILRIKAAPICIEITALTILVAGALFAFVAALSAYAG